MDFLSQIERMHGSVTEYNRSMEEDEASDESEIGNHERDCNTNYSEDLDSGESIYDDELPF